MSERGERVCQMRESGMTFKAIGDELGISLEHAHVIYKGEHHRRERDADPLYQWLLKASDEWHACHAFAALRKSGIKTVEQAERLTAFDVMELHGCSIGTADLLERAKGGEMSSQSRKGALFEQDTADYLAGVLGDDRIERRVKHGEKDRGDIAGVRIRGKRVVIECKNKQRMELAAWVDQAERERGNDDAEFAVVIHKRKGCGQSKFGGNYATMTLETLAAIIAGGRELLDDEGNE